MAVRKRKTIATMDDGQRRIDTLSQVNEPDNFRWEAAEEQDAHHAFTRWADHVRDRPSYVDRRKRNLLYASLYSNLPLLGFGVNSYTRNIPHQGRISLNATQNAIDSLVSKVCKNRPRPMFTTVEGDYELREKVENADKYVDGYFYANKYYTTIYPGKVIDAAIYGLGATKVHEVDGDCSIERTYPWELIYDDREAMYGSPVRMAQRKYYDKQETFDLWRRDGGKAAKEWTADLERVLDSQSVESDRADFDRDETSEQVVVYEGWRLPTSKRPGKKIVCVRGKTLRLDDFTDKEHPFTFLKPEVPLMGFYGIGICERVAGIQGEINRIIRDIQMAMHLIAKPHWMVEASSNVSAASLNNDIATIIKYSGATPPVVYAPQSMSSEVFQHLQFLYKTLYEITGISQMSAQSQKPAGLSSAVALRTYLNVETERFNDFVRATEESAAEDAMKVAKVIGSLAKKPKKVLARSGFKGRTIEQVSWSKMDLDTIAVQIYPTSKLPDTPAGRREYALELAQYTKVGTDDIFEMLEWDDTEAFARRRLAGKRNVERDIMKCRRGDKVIRDAVGDHEMAFGMMTDAYEEAKHDELPEERLAMMRNYIKATYRYLTGKAWVAGGPNPLPGQGPPPGQPGMPPPMPGGPMPMLPPGAPPPPPMPMANGGMPPQPMPPQGS